MRVEECAAGDNLILGSALLRASSKDGPRKQLRTRLLILAAQFARSLNPSPPSSKAEGAGKAAVADPVVQRAFSDVMQLVKPFELLDSPDIQSRIKACAETATVPG